MRDYSARMRLLWKPNDALTADFRLYADRLETRAYYFIIPRADEANPFSSFTTLWIRTPRMPTHAPTGSTPSCRAATATLVREPGSRAMALSSTVPLKISGTSCSNSRRTRPRWLRDTTSCGSRTPRSTLTR